MIYVIVMLAVVLVPSAAFYGCYMWADRYQSASRMSKAERDRRERDNRYAKMFRRA
jgi:hypothetical protein